MNPESKLFVLILTESGHSLLTVRTLRRPYLGCVDQLISQALGDGLDVPESSFSRSCAQQPDGLNKETEEEGEALQTRTLRGTCPVVTMSLSR